TWTWNGTTWTDLTPTGGGASPSARADHEMSSLGNGVLLFGGATSTGVVDDTWFWAGGIWAPIDTGGHAPVARAGHVMAPIDNGDRVLLYGGYDASFTFLDDTWIFDPSESVPADRWQEVVG